MPREDAAGARIKGARDIGADWPSALVPRGHGCWHRRSEFAGKDLLNLFPLGKEELILVVCTYTVGKDWRATAANAEGA
jgi:hypothetical protein